MTYTTITDKIKKDKVYVNTQQNCGEVKIMNIKIYQASIIIILIIIIIICFLGLTYAYFEPQINNITKINVTGTSDTVDNASVTSTNMSLNVGLSDMAINEGTNNYTYYTSSTSTLTLNVQNGTSAGENVCTYDITYTPTAVYKKSSANINNLKELAIVGNAKVTNGEISPSSFVEVNLNDIDSKITLVNNATLTVTGSQSLAVEVWTFTLKYYNLAINQTDSAGKSFGGTIAIENIDCKR